ncbi:MAG TPA: hypothetical protein VHY22_05510 [Chthoniobacteraceae bacterium]|jgi:hypothetical protein|nr:hypothetical protein [Chthoniobacteraceae bacterium]
MRNIHFTPDLSADNTAQPSQEAHPRLPRLRERTNDPLTEYRQRPGQVERLPDSVAALILCHKGRSVVERSQIKVTMEKKDYVFASADSLMIHAKNGTGEKVTWVMNRQNPDALHLLSDSGEYIETVPLKGQVAWFDTSDAAKRELADRRRAIARDKERLQELHIEDTARAVADARHNAGQVHHLVATFPAASNPAASAPRADRAAAAMHGVDQARETRVTRKRDLAARSRKTGGLEILGGDEPDPAPISSPAPVTLDMI